MGLADCFAVYRAAAASRGVRSLPQIDAARKHWLRFFGDDPAEGLNLDALMIDLEARLSPATARRVLGVGLAALRWSGVPFHKPQMSTGLALSTKNGQALSLYWLPWWRR